MLKKLFTVVKRMGLEIKEYALSLSGNNKGIGVVEVILILVVLIGLVVIFRDQLTTIINGIFQRIVNDTNAI